MKTTFLKSLLVAAGLCAGTSVWAADKTVVKYSFDDAMSPSLTAGSRVSFDYEKTSVITSTKFLNAWNNTNGDPGASTVSLGSTDLSGETWTLSFEWAACGGCNSKADHTTLKAGDQTLFDLTGNSNWNTTVTITYTGSDDSKTLPVPGCNKSYRFTAGVGNQYNTIDYWHHIVVTGSASGVKMTIRNSDSGETVVEDVVLSETNVNPTSLIIEPCCGGAIGIDELSLSYEVEGEVVQNPIPNYTAVNGAERTITATCETEGATIQHSTDGMTFEDGASITVSESGTVYFKAVKGTSESDVVSFDVVAGEITLNAPSIVRSDNTTVTITADQTDKLLSPTATIYYEYGEEIGEFTGSKVLTVAADATITAYAVADGYTTSATSERAVALFPTNVEAVENVAAKTSGWTTNEWGATEIVSERNYAPLLLDETQWGASIYFQIDAFWKFRNSGNWYNDSNTDVSWILMKGMKAGDIIVTNIDYAASDQVNATYNERLTYGIRHAYVVDADGDVELAFKKKSAAVMDYLYGIYVYRKATSTATTISATGFNTFSSSFDLDLANLPEGVKAYFVEAKNIKDNKVTLTEVTEAVEAGTGLLLKGEAGVSYNIPIAESAYPLHDNILVGCPTAVVLDKSTANYASLYVLAGTEKASFYNLKSYLEADESNAVSIPAGKAYLDASSLETARLEIVFPGEATGIANVNVNDNENGYYNLNGQRVAQPVKGLYIVNGKKVIK